MKEAIDTLFDGQVDEKGPGVAVVIVRGGGATFTLQSPLVTFTGRRVPEEQV